MHRPAMRSFEFVLLAGLLSLRGTTPEPPPPPHSLPFFPSTPPFSSPLPPSTSRTVSLTLSTREHMSTSGHLDTNMTAPAHLPSTATASPVFTSFADNSTGAPPNLSSALAPNFTSTRSLYYSGSLATRNTSLSNLSNSTRTGIEIVSENKTVVNTAESSPLSMSSQMPTSVAVTQVTVTGGEASSTTHQASSLAVLISLRTASTTSKHSSLTTVLQKRAPGNKQPQPEALSSGSVAAIVTGFIVIVILLFGGAYYFKMRRSTYGRLLDDCDYGSMGNFRNPMFEQ